MSNPGSTGRDRRPILCAIDESAPSDAALRIAADLAGTMARPLHLVHVCLPLGGSMDEVRGRRLLADAAAETRAAAKHLVFGETVARIAAVAEEVEPLLIVSGTHSRGRFGRLLLGSTANDLLRGCHWPLLVVRSDTQWPPRRVVIGDDGREASGRAGALAALIGDAYHSEVTLLHATPEIARISGTSDPRGRRASAAVVRTTRQLRDRAVAMGDNPERPIHTRVRLVSPELALEEASRSRVPVLLAVGRRSAVHAAGATGHSVSENLVRSARAAVLIYSEDAVAHANRAGMTAGAPIPAGTGS